MRYVELKKGENFMSLPTCQLIPGEAFEVHDNKDIIILSALEFPRKVSKRSVVIVNVAKNTMKGINAYKQNCNT